MVIVSASPLAEICTLCALEHGIRIVAIVDRDSKDGRMLGVPVLPSLDGLNRNFDGAVIADLQTPAQSFAWMTAALGAQRVLIPRFLGGSSLHMEAAQ